MLEHSAASDWILFFGRFHPVIVHLPIGFLLVAGLLEILEISGKITMSSGVSRAILLFSGITATLACVAGYMLSLSGGYDEQILTEHQWQGIWVAVLAWVAWLSKTDFLTNRLPFVSLLYVPAVVFSILMVFVAGHHGGSLTHGSDYLSQHTPEPFRGWLGMSPKELQADKPIKITNINQALVFQEVVHPIMKGHCEACHNAQKSKGGLRMDTIELLKKGGEDGPIFLAGNVDESEMIRRMMLPDDDEKHMPPIGKPQLSDAQVKLLKWWVASGASFDKKVSELTLTDDIKPILGTLGGGVIAGAIAALPKVDSVPKVEVQNIKFTVEDALMKEKVAAANPDAIASLQKAGALVVTVAQGANYLDISFVNNSKATDQEGIILSKVAEQAVWLKLGNTQISDKTMFEIAKLKHLTRLSLENTKITDAGLRAIKTMPNLEYLNLIGTAVTDAGVRELASLKNLKKLYLWQTKANAATLPHVEIDHGMDAKTISDFTKTAATVRNAKEPYQK